MRLLELNAIVIQQQAQRRARRQRRVARTLLTIGIVFAFAWILLRVSVSPLALEFGSVPVLKQSEWRSVTVTNHTSADLRPLIFLTGESVSEFCLQDDTCPVVSTGKSCAVQLKFCPHRPGDKDATLWMDMGPWQNELNVELTGKGVLPTKGTATPTPTFTGIPRIQIEPQGLNFAARPRRPQQVQVKNEGTRPFRITSVELTGADSDRFEIVNNECAPPIQLQADGECQISVRYKSRWNPKPSYTAVLEVAHNAPNLATPQRVNLIWESVPSPLPRITVRPTRLDFSGAVGGPWVPRTVIVSNVGNVPATNLSFRLGYFGGGEHGPFHHTSSCKEQLQPGEECTVDVTFSPPAGLTESKTFQSKLIAFDGPFRDLATVELNATVTATGIVLLSRGINGK